MPNNNITLADAAALLMGAERLLILTHERPDADTLGSAFALKYALECGSRRVEVVCADRIIEKYLFITGGRETLVEPDGYDPDVICAVDVASLNMLGALADVYADRVDLKIDHHGTGGDYAKYNYTEADSAACGEIVFGMLRDAGRMNLRAAEAVYAAVASDTGCFKFANTTQRTHRVAAEVMDMGVDIRRINHVLFESRSQGEIWAMRAALDGIHFYADGRIALISFTNEAKARLGFTDDDISPLHGLPREIKGVELGVTIRQRDASDDEYKVSLRSGGDIDCAALCSLFGGGGHRGAAGCTIYASSVSEAEKTIVDAIIKEAFSQ